MHAPSTLNALLAIGSAPAAGSGPTAAQLIDEDGKVFQQFLSMLGDFGAQTQAQGQGTQSGLLGQLLPTQSPAVLAAQGLDMVGDTATPIDPSQLINVEDANALLSRLSNFMHHENQGGSDNQPASKKALEAVKDQLENIVVTESPKTIGQILDAVPEAREPRLAGLLTGLMQVVRKAVTKEHTKDEETSAQAAANMQQPPANWFRTGDRTPETAPTAAEKPQEKESSVMQLADDSASATATVTIIEPLAQTSVASLAAVPAPAQPMPIEPSQLQPAIEIDSLSAPASLDQLVPALKPVETPVSPQAALLPEVNLPVVPGFGKAAAPKADEAEAMLATDKPTHHARDTSVAGVLGSLDAATSLDNLPQVAPHLQHGSMHATKTIDLLATPGFINHATVKEQVHVALTQASKEGLDKLTIQLEPTDLGRIEVNMQTSRDGVTQIRFLVDKPETFDSLSRDARYLERSLQEAGIKADTGSMQFNLRQQPQHQMHSGLGGQGQHGNQQTPNQPQETHAANSSTEISAVPALDAWTRHYLINVRDGVDISA